MSKTVAVYCRVSTDHQTNENQLLELRQVCDRMGWIIKQVYEDHAISGATGRNQRPGYDALYKAVARREVDMVMTWGIDRLGRSLQEVITFMSYVQERGIGLYVHQQGLDTTHSQTAIMMTQFLAIFAEYERSILKSRIHAGLERAKAQGKKLGRPGLSDYKTNRIKKHLQAGASVRGVAKLVNVSTGSVSKVKRAMAMEMTK
ncbi:recombinase family protein [Terasakiella brassicae]|uniref:recombinase family protein n=1 Tax=Terasakiella brassicae TaxID=1634917 RepID=UPI001663F3BB|nr:recombinase family protein [Terasakiella brassicae]